MAGEADVVCPRQGQDRAAERARRSHERHLGARSAEAQARGQALAVLRRRSLRSAAPVSGSRLNIGPLSQRSMNASTSPEASSWSAMASSAGRRRARRSVVLDARRHPDEHQRGRGPGRLQARRARASARRASSRSGHRARPRERPVPLQRPGAAVVGRSARTSPEPPCPGRSTATTREVLLEQLAEGAPEPTRLGEAVQRHQRRARAAYLDMEWHDR